MNEEFVEQLDGESSTKNTIGMDNYDDAQGPRASRTIIKDGTTIYPHTGVALIEITKVWFVVALMIAGLFYSVKNVLPPDLKIFGNLGIILLVVAAALFALQRILHYTNTYVEVTKDALIFRKGWVPHTIDTIFWVHIKDLNSSASITESILGTGTVKVIVAIRTSMALVEINYLPNHEEFATFIRERIGKFSEVTRQVTYT